MCNRFEGGGAGHAENFRSRGTALPGCQLQRTATRRASDPHGFRFTDATGSGMSNLRLALGDAGTPHRRAERLPRRRLTKHRLRCCHAPASLWSSAMESSSEETTRENSHSVQHARDEGQRVPGHQLADDHHELDPARRHVMSGLFSLVGIGEQQFPATGVATPARGVFWGNQGSFSKSAKRERHYKTRGFYRFCVCELIHSQS